MKKIRGVHSLIFSAMLVITLLTGCTATPEGKALWSALQKVNNIEKMQTKTNMKFFLSATDMSPQESQAIGMIFGALNGSQLTMDTKLVQNKEKTLSKAQSNMTMSIAGTKMDMGVWADVSVAGDKPVIKEVIMLPQMLMATMPPQFQNKKYFVIDSDEMAKVSDKNKSELNIDYLKLMNAAKQFNEKSQKFITNYMEQYNPDVKILTDLGTKQIVMSDGSNVNAHTYQVKINDEDAKKLIAYSVENFSKSKEAVEFLNEYKEYILNVIEALNMPENEKAKGKDEVRKSFDNLIAELPQLAKDTEGLMESLKKIKLLGDKGIDIKYYVNDDGYIVKQEGSVEFVLDMKMISALGKTAEKSSNEKNLIGSPVNNINNLSLQGTYTLGCDFVKENLNINKDTVTVDMPILSKDNAVSYVDFIKFITEESAKKQGVEQNKQNDKKPATIVISKKKAVVSDNKYYVNIKDVLSAVKGTNAVSKGSMTLKINNRVAILKIGGKTAKVDNKTYNFKVPTSKLIKNNVYIATDVLKILGINVVIK
ncbi:hypothetical protein Q428_09955 [Fervidicella metallireducens AeB]|uniref:Copper amine oxidase-like N-terminal domain-containing protein n=1 Tax=Fervidicella metallireducens AeB TaxID=1403537 RepID=A0A017RUJ4_9CLOT|nr:hypothetical protein [Fervidicella metallireducens]EYE88064.1 hypothetical protein Q428_09955 [Fervidicella metallireducens AeB]